MENKRLPNKILKKGGKTMFKKFTIALVICAMTVLLVPALPAAAAPSGNVTGKFGINAAPTVSVSLSETALTPQTSYTVTVNVADADTLEDIDELVLKLWYDSDGGTPLEGDFNSAGADAQNCAVVTWNPTDDATLAPAGTSWELTSYSAPTLTGTLGNFTFTIKIGKVATATSGSAKWQIAAVATDTANQKGLGYDSDSASMSWYGEIEVPSDAEVDWGTLAAGTQFNVGKSEAPLGKDITYISNGTYKKNVKSSATWEGTATANLNEGGTTTAAQSFALKAATTDTYSTAEIVKTTDVVIDSNGTQTTEIGADVTTMTLWIQLANSFTVATYSGTITYSISN